MATHVGLVCLGEAGNFGDDLILVAGVQAIMESIDAVKVRYTAFGHPLEWTEICAQLGVGGTPTPVFGGRDLPGSRKNQNLLADCDAIVFGGGGLLQTSHHPDRPYHWLGYLPNNVDIPVLAVGLGIGPLSPRWLKALGGGRCPFDACYLRDSDSVSLARNRLGWQARPCHDFVDSVFLRGLDFFRDRNGDSKHSKTMGVAIRAWPGLDSVHLARHVERVASASGADDIRFYVLEAPKGSGTDVQFTELVASHLGSSNVSIRAYVGAELMDFGRDMAGCFAAVSMKLHSSALWTALGIPVFPISYAPKTAAFFGVPYRGLEIFDISFLSKTEPSTTPRAREVVSSWLPAAVFQEDARGRQVISSHRRILLQSSSLAVNVGRKLAQFSSTGQAFVAGLPAHFRA